MDSILRKMFKKKEKTSNDGNKEDLDEDKFALQNFTMPELQKLFERQMQELLEMVKELEDSDVNGDGEFSRVRQEFEKNRKSFIDTDLDGEIYADQLHSLMESLTSNDATMEQRMNEHATILPRNDNLNRKLPTKKKLTDGEIILGRIHGTLKDEIPLLRPRTESSTQLPRSSTPFGNVFEGAYQGPKMFRQSVMTTTQRKPDGTTETTKVVQDSQGNKTTTITRTATNGKSETITKYDDNVASRSLDAQPSPAGMAVLDTFTDRNVYVSKQGYAIPRNLW